MAVAIQHKRSQTTGDAPSASDIAQGEIALNLADLRLFTKDHNNAIQRIGGEDVAATLDFTKADGTVGGISVTGFKMNFKKANGTLTTYNIFQQMMLFSLFQGQFVSRAVFNVHQHTETQVVTFDNDTAPSGTTSVPI
tara:strand:- start:770 stop:1183 length:414 start_codon:yes stop_codon:yes gene_type:complete